MSQAKLIKVEEVENGIKLTFLDFEGNEKSGVYNGNKLDLKNLEKMIGHSVSFTQAKDKYEQAVNNFINVHKAWEENSRPSFCDDPKHGMDR